MPSVTRRELVAAAAGAASAFAVGEANAEQGKSMLTWDETERCWWMAAPSGADRLRLSGSAPRFEFASFTLGGEAAGPAEWRSATESGASVWHATWQVTQPVAAEITARIVVDERAGLARKSAAIRLLTGEPALLKRVELDRVVSPDSTPPVTRRGWQSYPAFFRSFFVGFEYPVGFATGDGGAVTVGHAPGKRVELGQAFTTRSAVFGRSQPGKAREAFNAYLSPLRPAPAGVHFNYNSWWTSPVPYTEADILGIIAEFRKHLFEPYGVCPDTFCIDMGWSDPKSLWRIDGKLFPRGFDGLDAACRAVKSHLGLWISPCAGYPPALDIAWAASQGYEAIHPAGAPAGYACLGGPKYAGAIKQALVGMVERAGVRHIKLDGYRPVCDVVSHGHSAGEEGCEAIADGFLAAVTAVRKAAPDVWLEPTCMGYDPSPWWLTGCDSVIGTFGDDSPPGRVPSPVYRESSTSARDYFNLKGARDILAPIAAQEVLGIIHQTPEPLQNDAIVSVLRGHQFQPLYLNPKHMTPRRWEFLAALMQWARVRGPLLANTVPILPASWRKAGGGPGISEDSQAPREPYGYGHWHEGRGLICLRNPWIEQSTPEMRLAEEIGAPAGMHVDVVSIYPERRVLHANVTTGDPLRLDLAPYETMVAEIVPAAPTRRGADRVERARPEARLQARLSRFAASGDGPAFGPDYTRPIAPGKQYVRLRMSGEVKAPAGVRTEILVLAEGVKPVTVAFVTARVADKPAVPDVVRSVAGWTATGMQPPEHWDWVCVPVKPGTAEVDVDVTADGEDVRLSAWVVTRSTVPWRKLRKVDGNLLPPPEERWLTAQSVMRPSGASDALPLETGDGPVERINGVFLDTLDPVEVTQGYGTLQRNQSVWEKPMVMGGRPFARGLGTHSPSRIVYKIPPGFRRFAAWAGADQATGPTITMEVRLDGKSVWKTGLLTRADDPVRVDVPLSGATTLELLVTDGGNGIGADHADWADAAFLR